MFYCFFSFFLFFFLLLFYFFVFIFFLVNGGCKAFPYIYAMACFCSPVKLSSFANSTN